MGHQAAEPLLFIQTEAGPESLLHALSRIPRCLQRTHRVTEGLAVAQAVYLWPVCPSHLVPLQHALRAETERKGAEHNH